MTRLIVPAWIHIIIYLHYNSRSIIKLSKDLNISYSHCCFILKELEEKGFIVRKMVGRYYVIYISEKFKPCMVNFLEVIDNVR